jgi:hypothetical protein
LYDARSHSVDSSEYSFHSIRVISATDIDLIRRNSINTANSYKKRPKLRNIICIQIQAVIATDNLRTTTLKEFRSRVDFISFELRQDKTN